MLQRSINLVLSEYMKILKRLRDLIFGNKPRTPVMNLKALAARAELYEAFRASAVSRSIPQKGRLGRASRDKKITEASDD